MYHLDRYLIRKFSKYLFEKEYCSINGEEGGEKDMSFAETFKALSDPLRREILTLLKTGRMSAGEIGSHFDMTGATVSYHLNILKKADLVYEEREKNFIYYNSNTVQKGKETFRQRWGVRGLEDYWFLSKKGLLRKVMSILLT